MAKGKLDCNQKELWKHFSPDSLLGSEEKVHRIIDWITYYRRNIHRFASHYLGLSLHLYQSIILYMMNLFPTIALVASRATAKSYIIAIFACCRAILYPNSPIVIASATKKQAKLIVAVKIKQELMRDSPVLAMEIDYIRDSDNDTVVVFKNGSTITVVPAAETARGNRSVFTIYEEFRMITKKIIDDVFVPMLVIRQAPYLKKSEYAYLAEECEQPRSAYISSAWYKSHWMWGLIKSIFENMSLIGTPREDECISCVVALDYSVTLRHAIKTRRQLKADKKKLDPISWAIEFENRMVSERAHSYFGFELLSGNQKLTKAFYPRKNIDVAAKNKNKYAIPKQDGEIRIISCDIAMMEGTENDNSVYSCVRLLPETTDLHHKGYRRQVPYIEAVNGAETTWQAIRIKQLFDDFDADFCVLDGRNSGVSVYDALAKVLYDVERDVEYRPWVCMNDSKFANRITMQNAKEVVYVVSATAQRNSEIAVEMRNALASHKIDLLINPNAATSFLLEKMPEYAESIDADVQLFYEKPYLETMFAVNEMLDLEYEKLENTGIIKIIETGTKRKDRYTSISYANWFASEYERDMISSSTDHVLKMPLMVSKIEF